MTERQSDRERNKVKERKEKNSDIRKTSYYGGFMEGWKKQEHNWKHVQRVKAPNYYVKCFDQGSKNKRVNWSSQGH